ncbi:MAG: hypothetical protein ACRCS9_15260 [Hyphomicrobium sp.]
MSNDLKAKALTATSNGLTDLSDRERGQHTMGTLCKILTRGFAILYLLALALWAISTFGLFGQEADPLSAVFLVLLGWPWTLVLEQVLGVAGVWTVVIAPLFNLLLITGLCRLVNRN